VLVLLNLVLLLGAFAVRAVPIKQQPLLLQLVRDYKLVQDRKLSTKLGISLSGREEYNPHRKNYN